MTTQYNDELVGRYRWEDGVQIAYKQPFNLWTKQIVERLTDKDERMDLIYDWNVTNCSIEN